MKCHPHTYHGLPSVPTAVAPQRAWLSLGAACGTVVPGWLDLPAGAALMQAGHRCKDGLDPQDTCPFFHSYQERSPVLKQSIHTGFCCPLVCPESSSSPWKDKAKA